MNLDYTSVQQKIEAISTGGHFIYEFSSYSSRCESICNSNYIHDGCAFGHKCKIRSSCQNGHCVCTLGCMHLVNPFIIISFNKKLRKYLVGGFHFKGHFTKVVLYQGGWTQKFARVSSNRIHLYTNQNKTTDSY